MDSSLGRSISFGPFRLYPDARVVERDGARVPLGSRALDILIVLTERAGEVVSHKELTQRVWRSLVVSPGNLRVHIAGLRKALNESGGALQYIANVPGQGYCFVAPIRRLDSTELVSRPQPARLLTLTAAGECDPTLVVQAGAIGLGSKGNGPLAEAIAERLATNCLLLVFDNAMTLAEAMRSILEG